MGSTTHPDRRTARAAVLSFLTAAALATTAARPAESPRVVAVGDIHGAYESLVEVLRAADVLDGEDRWAGGTTVFVQTGDYLDRGGRARDVVELLMRLQGEAEAAGGRVVPLLGNHELMNLVGDLRDVAPETIASFADEESEARREQAFEDWREWILARARARGMARPELPPDIRERWMDEHPPGFLEHWEALGPAGRYGTWLRERPVAFRVADTLFMHAGLSEAHADMSIEQINDVHYRVVADYDRVRAELVAEGVILPYFTLTELYAVVRQEEEEPLPGRGAAARKEAVQRASALLERLQELLTAEAPLWYRGYSELSEAELAPLVDTLASRHAVRHLVSAHSPIRTATIVERLGGRIFLIDTGMLTNVYHGRPSALEIRAGVFSAIYPEERRVLLDEEGEASLAGTAALRVPHRTGRLRPVPAVFAQEPEPGTEAPPARRWYDVDGNVLPFRDDEEIVAFLRTAPIVDQAFIGSGVTKPKKLTLERDGVRVHASFRYFHEEKRNVRLADGSNEMFFLDSYRNEVPAYELGRLLGMDNIPPTVLREVDGQEGSVQIWVEDSVTQKQRTEEGTPVPGTVVVRFNRQTHDMDVFDNLVRNIDRNAGNIVWDKDWNLWLIDCTRCFAQGKDLPKPGDLVKISRPLWERLRALDEAALDTRLGAHLTPFQIKALLARRDKIVEALEKRIRQLGEEEVLFEYGEPVGGVAVSYDET